MRGRAVGRGSLLLVVALLAGLVQAVLAPAASAQTFVPISGSGSTWSFNALDQWRRNLEQLLGLRINYAPSGSSQGRVEFRNGTVDFAVSEIEYGLTDNGVVDVPPARGFAYAPLVAGGLGFMYNLRIDGKQVTALRLSGDVLARIFTKQITDWSDPAIAADNPGLALPARPIVPVVRSDGSGTTAQFTRWLAARHGAIWDAYCGRPACGLTSIFPVLPGIEAKSGSQGVAGFVAQASSEGAITYVESSYARNVQFPVVKVLNDAGFYVTPTAGNVAVALTGATVRADLTADLGGVYTNTDPRSYPLSSYSYLILPTDNNGGRFTTDKGAALSEFGYYAVCAGQQQADALGYSPLPINLVRSAVDQFARIPGTTNRLTSADLTGCNNPTVGPGGTNAVVANAPQPQECDRQGPSQCGTGGGGIVTPTPSPTAVPVSPTPTPTASPVPTPTPTAEPSPTAAPTPIASPGPSPRPHRPRIGYVQRLQRLLAELLARIYQLHPRHADRTLAWVFASGHR